MSDLKRYALITVDDETFLTPCKTGEWVRFSAAIAPLNILEAIRASATDALVSNDNLGQRVRELLLLEPKT
jgi:hypothetical protein